MVVTQPEVTGETNDSLPELWTLAPGRLDAADEPYRSWQPFFC